MNSERHEPESVYRIGTEELRRHWLLAVILGIGLIVLGAIALSISFAVTLASMLVLGWLLLIGGVVQGIHAFAQRRWDRFFLDLLLGTLYVVVGLVVIANPLAAELAVTLMLIAFFLVAGIFRVVAASVVPFRNRWSIVVSGIISFLLGILLWAGWPETALWVIGVFIGIELIFNGWSVLMLGLAARHLPGTEVPHAP